MYASNDICYDKMYAMDDRIDFSQWLQEQMNERGLSQSDLARLAGVTRSSINGILVGTRGPGPDLCNAIARGLKLPPEVVFRAAGLLPPKPNAEPTVEEASYKLSQLPDWQQKIVLRFIDSLLTEGNDANSTIPMAPSNNK
jgi:transcriptional regulator with XRE-family HTH domain